MLSRAEPIGEADDYAYLLANLRLLGSKVCRVSPNICPGRAVGRCLPLETECSKAVFIGDTGGIRSQCLCLGGRCVADNRCTGRRPVHKGDLDAVGKSRGFNVPQGIDTVRHEISFGQRIHNIADGVMGDRETAVNISDNRVVCTNIVELCGISTGEGCCR
ncbi:hypothetical protein D3C78_1239270 [compost metagenome]